MTNDGLTDRQREIAELIAVGYPDKAIAAKLGISAHTVKNHVSSIVRAWKLDADMNIRTLVTRRILCAA
jgi:DNA-binding NarL/FixJ family response regulator